MLMTSSEAVKEPWGAINLRDGSNGSKTSTDSNSATALKRPSKSKNEVNDEKMVLVDDADCDSQ